MTSTTRNRVRRAVATAVTVTAALVLAACGAAGDGEGDGAAGAKATASADAHNAQDVTFAQGMIPHHRQALEMAELAADRASSTQVKDLAARIERAQDPEIGKLTGWLRTWGEDVPEEGATEHGSHGGGMAGMTDDAGMEELAKASGEAFDTAFLTLMVEHHEGAVDMAGTERDKGRYAPAKSLADDIVTGQSAEIAEMKGLLGKSS
ncbi:DUF305 domain-containing protein [Streptomyces phaeofaciens]|uniref:DUF305 domain-containing protein n=1 Tax=Streptomyces phaeofaciens TaxID=68254 RepID=UPI0036A88487